MKMTAACLLLPDVFGDDSSLFAAVNEEVGDSTSSCGLAPMSCLGISLSLLVAQISSWRRMTFSCLLDKRQTFAEMLVKFKAVLLGLLIFDVVTTYSSPNDAVILFEIFFFLIQVKVLTPVLEVKNPFDVNSCRFALYIEKQEVAQLSDCTTALAALVAAFHVYNIQCPSRIQRTLKFLVSLIFEMDIPQAFLPGQVKRGLEIPKHPSVCQCTHLRNIWNFVQSLRCEDQTVHSFQ